MTSNKSGDFLFKLQTILWEGKSKSKLPIKAVKHELMGHRKGRMIQRSHFHSTESKFGGNKCKKGAFRSMNSSDHHSPAKEKKTSTLYAKRNTQFNSSFWDESDNLLSEEVLEGDSNKAWWKKGNYIVPRSVPELAGSSIYVSMHGKCGSTTAESREKSPKNVSSGRERPIRRIAKVISKNMKNQMIHNMSESRGYPIVVLEKSVCRCPNIHTIHKVNNSEGNTHHSNLYAHSQLRITPHAQMGYKLESEEDRMENKFCPWEREGIFSRKANRSQESTESTSMCSSGVTPMGMGVTPVTHHKERWKHPHSRTRGGIQYSLSGTGIPMNKRTSTSRQKIGGNINTTPKFKTYFSTYQNKGDVARERQKEYKHKMDNLSAQHGVKAALIIQNIIHKERGSRSRSVRMSTGGQRRGDNWTSSNWTKPIKGIPHSHHLNHSIDDNTLHTLHTLHARYNYNYKYSRPLSPTTEQRGEQQLHFEVVGKKPKEGETPFNHHAYILPKHSPKLIPPVKPKSISSTSTKTTNISISTTPITKQEQIDLVSSTKLLDIKLPFPRNIEIKQIDSFHLPS